MVVRKTETERVMHYRGKVEGAEVQRNVGHSLSITLKACSPSGEPPFKPCLDFQPHLRQLRLGERTHEVQGYGLLVELVQHVAVGVAAMDIMQEGSIVHILFRLQRDDHWEEPVRNEQVLPFC